MDLPPLTDDSYCGLKVVAKGEKEGVLVIQRGGMGCRVVIGADSANCGFNSRRFTHSTGRP